MKRTYCVMIRARAYLKAHTGALILGLASVCMSSLASPAWGQWTGGPTGPIYYNGGNVGIGTTNPSTVLEAAGNLTLSGVRSVIFTTGDNAATMRGGIQFLTFDNGINNIWTPTDQYGNPQNSTIRLGGFGNFNSQVVNLAVSGAVGIGTTSPQYLLSVNGTIGAKDVIVTNTGWSDYVFRPGYRLRPLSEVNAYIQAHHHLPDIPSEAEVKENGVSVGEMQSKLLAKLEELTLHMIQQEKENKELRERIAQLETRAASSGAPAGGR